MKVIVVAIYRQLRRSIWHSW